MVNTTVILNRIHVRVFRFFFVSWKNLLVALVIPKCLEFLFLWAQWNQLIWTRLDKVKKVFLDYWYKQNNYLIHKQNWFISSLKCLKYNTGIPRLPRFLVARFHFARIFEAAVLYYKISLFDNLFWLYYDSRSANFK